MDKFCKKRKENLVNLELLKQKYEKGERKRKIKIKIKKLKKIKVLR